MHCVSWVRHSHSASPPHGVGAVAGHCVSWVRHSHSAPPPPHPHGAEAVACAQCFLGETLSHSAPKGIRFLALRGERHGGSLCAQEPQEQFNKITENNISV